MMRSSPIVIAIVVIVGSGVIDGLLTDRWALSAERAASAANLAQVPKLLGSWEGEDLPLDPDFQERQGIEDFLYRLYVNPQTGSRVHVFLVCGRPGPVSNHTPEICYESAGYTKDGTTDSYSPVPGASDNFLSAKFIKHDAVFSDQLRIFWAWNPNGHWQVPKHPRMTFFRYPALFKLYVIRHFADVKESLDDDDPALDLMRLLLPELQRCLFPET
jgi:hypothetical protein